MIDVIAKIAKILYTHIIAKISRFTTAHLKKEKKIT